MCLELHACTCVSISNFVNSALSWLGEGLQKRGFWRAEWHQSAAGQPHHICTDIAERFVVQAFVMAFIRMKIGLRRIGMGVFIGNILLTEGACGGVCQECYFEFSGSSEAVH